MERNFRGGSTPPPRTRIPRSFGDGGFFRFGTEAAAFATAWLAGAVMTLLALAVGRRLATGASSTLLPAILLRVRNPLLLVLPSLLTRSTLPAVDVAAASGAAIRHVLAVVLILGVGWLLIELTRSIGDWLDMRYRIDERDDLGQRAIDPPARPGHRCGL